MRRWRQLAGWFTRALLGALLTVLVVVAAALLLIQTTWAHERLRDFVVRTANQYLTGTLEIGALGGSFVRGIQIDDLRLSRDGRTIISVDHAEVSYSIRELVSPATLIRKVSLVRPRVVASRLPDGRWDLASLVRPRRSSGPASTRPLRIDAIEVRQADIRFNDELSFGAVHLPATFANLDVDATFAMSGGGWTFDIGRVAFEGAKPALIVTSLSGGLANSDAGWFFRSLRVNTPGSSFTVDGRVERGPMPTTLDLHVSAQRFAFQEWGGVLHGLANIAVDANFEARLNGPLPALHTVVGLRSTGGNVDADVVLDTTVEGWHANGSANVSRFDLARWLNRSDRPSDITGSTAVDIDLHLGGHFPGGSFRFGGPHAAYLDYEADNVVASGTINGSEVHVNSFTARAYRSNVRLRPGSTVGIDAPYPFRFVGSLDTLDLRQVPRNVPVPHVESTLALDFDVDGRFDRPYIRGDATFAESRFLGAQVGAGSVGHIDTSADPVAYAGEGDLTSVDLHHFGEVLDIGWLQDPRWAGTVRGHFRVNGEGSGPSIALTGGGRLERATLFGGLLDNADVTFEVRDGSLEGTYDGELVQIDPSIPMADERYSGRLTGRARGRMQVRDLLLRTVTLDDYSLEAAVDARESQVRGLDVDRASAQVALDKSTMRIQALKATSRGADLTASGALELDGRRNSRIEYSLEHGDLGRWPSVVGAATGIVNSRGVLTGTLDRLQFEGDADLDSVEASGVAIPAARTTYDVTLPPSDPVAASGSLTLTADAVTGAGQLLREINGRVMYDAGATTLSLKGLVRQDVPVTLTSAFRLDIPARHAAVTALTLDVRQASWRLAPGSGAQVSWTDADVAVDRLAMVDVATGRQLVAVSGTWGTDSRVQFETRNVSVDALWAADAAPVPYGGTLNASGTLTGTREHPAVSVDFAVTAGRVRRLAYERFGGHVDYSGEQFDVDVRLDQSAGVFVTAAGSVPPSLFDRTLPAQPLHVAVKSTPISLTLLEGVTDVVRNVTGQMELDFTVIGTTSDPHFEGHVSATNAAFEVVSSGARYRNGRAALQLANDRIGVEALHVEDEDRHALDVTGSLGTHELRVGELRVSATARGFQILRNEFGRVSVDAQIAVAGDFESPEVTGRVAVSSGSVQVDRILDRTLFQPYSTEAAPAPAEVDPFAALNPWARTRLNVQFVTPGTLRMVGENVQVSPGTPIGLGNINLRVFGELNFYKDPAQPLYVTGSLDSLTGTYVFQGRRFDVEPSSSIEFRGDLNPELYITVDRLISGVQTHVSIIGPLRQPELRLTSQPPLDPSNILSLIVFNTSTNDLTALQQQQLAVRAGTLAAGFIAAPMMTALERTLGLDTLEIEPGTGVSGGTRVTVGEEIAPGLVARFSRQFGTSQYDEAQLEYYLSRLFRIRATFSDAATLIAESPFRRVERAGIDLLLFFSF